MVIFDNEDVQILLKNGTYYLRMDLGHFVPKFEEIEISKEDAEKVMADPEYAIQLVWDYRNRLRGLI